MKNCLLKHFIFNNEIKSSCDYDSDMYSQENTVYEVLRVIQQKPLFLEEHIDRFYQSLYLSKIQAAISVSELINSLKALINSNQLINGNIRFQFGYTEQNQPKFLALVIPANYPSADTLNKGVQVLSLMAERENPNVKYSNLAARAEANNILSEQAAFEVLLINSDGFVTEGSRSNVFFVFEEKLITPPLSEVLPGVTRSKIIELSKKNKIAVEERKVNFAELKEFDAAFLSGTSINVLPIQKINNLSFSPQNKLARKIQLLYNKSITEDIDRFSWYML